MKLTKSKKNKDMLGLSIMIPALNEQTNLKNTVQEIRRGLRSKKINYELIIIDDGSRDKTGEIADKLAKQDKRICVIHHRKNYGIGYSNREVIRKARFDYFTYVPGDNQLPFYAISDMVTLIGKADVIIPYVTNTHIRPLRRRVVSWLFTKTNNILFDLNLKYYNGTAIYRTGVLRDIPHKTDGFGFQAEQNIRLLKLGVTYIEYGYDMYERQGGDSTAIKPKNTVNVIKIIASLFWEFQISKGIKRSFLSLF